MSVDAMSSGHILVARVSIVSSVLVARSLPTVRIADRTAAQPPLLPPIFGRTCAGIEHRLLPFGYPVDKFWSLAV